ncbi:LLM class flavin-dependent oxidoreductase [Mycobacterium spongiae]|uniref:LLM class flavin-dependent oxidoreductase n=1 Tax=Mycobacterium spongiae TaxID=886343 RepID=A0A975K055_9MYCO|nr:LLM class flavin-dependent oxidoreductase [Mycobacterium spongiae]QUR68598.1 LLM class flavin-dependent oxidoreductase [Mycobacterium spongiae]
MSLHGTLNFSDHNFPRPKVRLGCVYLPQFGPERLAATARVADEAALDELWLWEDCFLSGGISAAAIALSHSARLTVGIGVLPVPMRNVALTAMEIATLDRAFPGRVRIGVGHGVQDWMGQIGGKVSSPMTLLREYVTCLTALLDGEVVSYHGQYMSLSDVRLAWPPEGDVDLLVAAKGPLTLQLSGELATGTVLADGTAPDAVRAAIGHIDRGRANQSAIKSHSIVTYVLCATDPDARTGVDDEILDSGFDDLAQITAPDDAPAIADAAQRWIDAGTDTLVLQPAANVDIEDFVRFVGAQVQPLLHQVQ